VSDAAVKLANLAKKDHLAVVALSSITDKGGRASNAAPTLGDLRQSGDIQYEASTVVLLHREVDENRARLSETGWMIIAKQRGGETGQFAVRFNDRLLFDTGDRKPVPAVQRQYALSQERGYAG
jgi:replicative DNA helicase